MDETEFTGEGLDPDQKFWLFQPDVTQDVVEARKKLGETQGWTDENWHENPDNLRTLFSQLDNRDSALLDRLGQANDDSTKVGTLSEVVAAATAVVQQEQKTVEEHPAPPVGEKAPDVVPAAPATEVAKKKVSLFAKKKPDNVSASEPAAPPAPDTPRQPEAQESSTSPGSGVPAAGAVEGALTPAAPPAPEKKGFFARKPPAAANAPAEPAGLDEPSAEVNNAPASESGEAPAAESAPAPPSLEDLHAEVLGFGADPDNPLSDEEAKAMVADPDFAKKLADAEKEIEDQLSALESEGVNV